MKSFGRAVRLALRQRTTLAGVVACSLLVAVLWGGNIGAVYPFVEVIFAGKSLRHWVDDQIARAELQADHFTVEIAALEQARGATADPAEQRRLAREISYKQSRLRAETDSLERYRWLQPSIHRYLPAEPFPTLLVVLAALLVGTAVKNLFLGFNLILVERIAQQTTHELRTELFRRTLRLDMSSFGDDRTGQLLSRFTYDLEAINGGLNVLFGKAVREPLKMAACLAGAAFVCWRLLLLSLLITPLSFFIISRLAASIKRANRRAMEEMGLLYNRLGETFGGIQAVKAFGTEPIEQRRFDDASRKFFGKAMRIAFYNALTRPTSEMMGMTVIILAILAGGYLVLNQETHLLGLRMSERPLEIGSLMLFYALLVGVSDPARKMADVLHVLQRGVAAAERVFPQLDREPTIQDPAEPVEAPAAWRELRLAGVSFHYTPDQPVLRDLSLTIGYGETIAIVGANGCGKTTLISLLPRFFDPTAGAVLLDEVDLRRLRVADLRARIGMVTQQTVLFDDTVLENIRYGSPHATDEQAIAAAQQAHAHRFIVDKLSDGYQTQLGERGGKLSGGQRQRIALARAILRDPQILILDEATSQVDIESETLIHQALAEFKRGRTTLMITHRAATLSLADRVLVMDAGRVVDFGPHHELIGRCELYARLYQSQFRQTA